MPQYHHNIFISVWAEIPRYREFDTIHDSEVHPLGVFYLPRLLKPCLKRLLGQERDDMREPMRIDTARSHW